MPALPHLTSCLSCPVFGSLNFLGLDYPLDWFSSFKPSTLGNVYVIGWYMSLLSSLYVYSWKKVDKLPALVETMFTSEERNNKECQMVINSKKKNDTGRCEFSKST